MYRLKENFSKVFVRVVVEITRSVGSNKVKDFKNFLQTS